MKLNLFRFLILCLIQFFFKIDIVLALDTNANLVNSKKTKPPKTSESQFILNSSLIRFQNEALPNHAMGTASCSKGAIKNSDKNSEIANSMAGCSETLLKLSQDDTKDRSLGLIPSIVGYCHVEFANSIKLNTKDKKMPIANIRSASLLQSAFESNMFSQLGSFTHQSLRVCLNQVKMNNPLLVSKFYYYISRLNQMSSQLAQEQIYIQKLFHKPTLECPSENFLHKAHEDCQKSVSCSVEDSLDKLSQKTENDEKLFQETQKLIEKMPAQCHKDNQFCTQRKGALVAVIQGLVEKSPWLIDPDFIKSKEKQSTKDRVAQFLRTKEQALIHQQSELLKASMCLHGKNTEECNLDQLRETLDSTDNLKIPEIQNSATDKILQQHLQLNQCIEEKSLDRNRQSKIINESYLTARNAAITTLAAMVTPELLAAKAGLWVYAGLGAAYSTNFVMNMLDVKSNITEMEKACELNGQFAELKTIKNEDNGNSIVNNSNINSQIKNKNYSCASSEGMSYKKISENKSSCKVEMGLAALSALPIVGDISSLLLLSQKSGFIKKLKDLNNPLKRESDLSKLEAERRLALISNEYVPVLNKSDLKNKASIRSIPHYLEDKIQISKLKKQNGSEVYIYEFPVQLKDGTWVRDSKEFLIDKVTGAIQANDPAGLQLFELLAKQKAGSAHLAFVDVGILGFVNNNFKEGKKAGDRYLKSVADIILEHGEGKITLARTGGDEFGLLIDETDPQKVKKILEKIQYEIRNDKKAEARQVFYEQKLILTEEYRTEYKRLLDLFPKAAPNAQLNDLYPLTRIPEEYKVRLNQIKEKLDAFAKMQQPDVSIGSVKIMEGSQVADLFLLAEPQAQQMKIFTALNFGRSAAKYGSKEVPSKTIKPNALAPIQDPLIPDFKASTPPQVNSSSALKSLKTTSTLQELREMKHKKLPEEIHFADTTVAKYENEAGQTYYKVQNFITDPFTQKRISVLSDLPTKGKTGLFDGTHPVGEKVIFSHFNKSTDNILVMTKLKSLRYFNYFSNGTSVGDEMLALLSEVLSRNIRSTDLNFKLNGADFLMSLLQIKPIDLKEKLIKINKEFENHPEVKRILLNEVNHLKNKLTELKVKSNNLQGDALAAMNVQIADTEKRIVDVQNFKLDLQFETVTRPELSANPNLEEVQDLFDKKFAKK